MISLSVVILFFVMVFAALFLIFGTTRNSQIPVNKRHPHRKLTGQNKSA